MSTGNFLISQMSLENAGRVPESKGAILCDWCPRMWIMAILWWTNTILLQVCSWHTKHTWAAHLCLHTFSGVCLKKRNSFLSKQNIQRGNKKQLVKFAEKFLNCNPGFQQFVWSLKHSLSHYPCFNHYFPWHHNPNHLFSLFLSSPHGKMTAYINKTIQFYTYSLQLRPLERGKKKNVTAIWNILKFL